MDGTAWAGVFTLVGTLIGLGFTAYKFRTDHRTTETFTGYDQIQEDLAGLRVEFNKEKAERKKERESDQVEIRYQAGVIRHLDDEINDLRARMADAGITPPARRPWPTYPGQGVGADA